MNAMQPLAPQPMRGHNPAQDMNSTDHDLRAQLALAIAPSQSHGYNDTLPPTSSSASPPQQHMQHNIDPAIGGMSDIMSGSAGDSGDDNGDGRKGAKRELSQSKRAAQNRAAQRAFRQRKEGYIKKLEEQVRELHTLEDSYKAIQTENYSLREYIIHLQSRLIEDHGEYPQPPANISLNHPRDPVADLHTLSRQPGGLGGVGVAAGAAAGAGSVAPIASSGANDSPLEARAMSQLQASAQRAVADLTDSHGSRAIKRAAEEAYMGAKSHAPGKRLRDTEPSDVDVSEELNRQLRATRDGLQPMTRS
ncbi:MAG: hypothetical protein M1818_007941 [Claussenomyces sp. TS43310]|nr:MAG: hypothetical protein M1818_007941 [Claussenomyces sp. TS43310]